MTCSDYPPLIVLARFRSLAILDCVLPHPSTILSTPDVLGLHFARYRESSTSRGIGTRSGRLGVLSSEFFYFLFLPPNTIVPSHIGGHMGLLLRPLFLFDVNGFAPQLSLCPNLMRFHVISPILFLPHIDISLILMPPPHHHHPNGIGAMFSMYMAARSDFC